MSDHLTKLSETCYLECFLMSFNKNVYLMNMVSSQFWTPPLTSGLYPPLGLPPPLLLSHCSSIYKSPQEMLIHDLWKDQNCQVADKCIDTTFTINILYTSLPLSLYQNSIINNNMVNKITWINWFNYKVVIASQRTSKC